jgi:hypothetical protein
MTSRQRLAICTCILLAQDTPFRSITDEQITWAMELAERVMDVVREREKS